MLGQAATHSNSLRAHWLPDVPPSNDVDAQRAFKRAREAVRIILRKARRYYTVQGKFKDEANQRLNA